MKNWKSLFTTMLAFCASVSLSVSQTLVKPVGLTEPSSISVGQVAKKQQVVKVASLVNPLKLSSLKLGNRAANPRFRKLMYWINQAEQAGMSPKLYLDTLYHTFNQVTPYATKLHVYAPRTERMNLEAQYRLGKRFGIFTAKNLSNLRKGKSPVATRGKYLGQKLHVDHILSKRDYPELENSMANLSWLPAKLNLSKGAKVTNAAINRAELLTKEVGWRKN